MAEENKKTRKPYRDRTTVLREKIEKTNNQIATLESKLTKAKEQLAKFQSSLEMATNTELRKQKEEEQKKIAKFIKERGLTLEQLESLVK